MNCKDCQLYSSAYVDNMLSEEEELEFKNHIRECSSCNIALENLKIIIESTSMLEEVELPTNFSNELHEKLQDAKNHKTKSVLSGKGKILSGVVAMLLILIISFPLVNNFLNYNKGIDFSAEISSGRKHKDASPDFTAKGFDGVGTYNMDESDSVKEQEVSPDDQQEISDNFQEGVQEDSVSNDKDKYGDADSVVESGDDTDIAVNKATQDLPNNKNPDKIVSSIVVLILIPCIGILIYKIQKK